MEATTRQAARRRFGWGAKVALFLAVLGPGIITASADNDVGGITVYSQAGAQFGYSILWTLIPITIALIVIQEMCARMGAVTGKGLAGLIREHFGVRWTFFVMLGLAITNVLTTAAEFAGVAVAAAIFRVPPLIAVPVVAALVYFLVLRTSRGTVEKVFLVLSALYLTYVVSGFRAAPKWHDVWKGFLIPTFSHNTAYLWMIIALIGTTISPWMQFYIQSSIVEKGIRIRDYALSRVDVIFGCLVTDFMSFFMIMATAATIFIFNVAHPMHQYVVNETADLAKALEPIAGAFAVYLFAFG
ncbi:MAG: Nramp family divalent metal transporter, partial [Candidatus Eremiobacteraeota bacterium]|nr:Nramp family divalent metal transporter [Candidatus Eremiobacteraeota bacterium]